MNRARVPRWLWRVLARIRSAAREGRVRFTHKATEELAALDLGLDEDDCRLVLERLTPLDSCGRIHSEKTGERMYVFKPTVLGTTLYVKIVLRGACIVVSFHAVDENGDTNNT